MGKKRTPEIYNERRDYDNHSDVEEVMISGKSKVTSIALQNLQCYNRNGERMNTTKIVPCNDILKKLMNHEYGWVFNQPVDPVKLNIPDYFSIISNPMDLGTIRKRLTGKLYVSTCQFADDVRLTFSNAMLYNPPGNAVHVMAKQLNDMFNASWKSLEAKWSGQDSNPAEKVTNIQKKTVTPNCVGLLSKKTLTYAERFKLRKDLANILVRNIPTQLVNFLRKECTLEKVEDMINLDINKLDEETLVKLHRIVRRFVDARSLKSEQEIGKYTQGSARASMRGNAGSSSRRTSANANDSAVSAHVKASERLSDREDHLHHSLSHNQEHVKKSRVQMDEQCPDLDGVIRNTLSHSLSPSSRTTSCGKGEDLPCLEPLSPTRALRAATLKSRFADTIVKAQQRALLDHGKKVDPAKLRLEKEKLERRQQEEKARIEAQVRAAEAAARMKAEAELKMKREQEREAARLALQKVLRFCLALRSQKLSALAECRSPKMELPWEAAFEQLFYRKLRPAKAKSTSCSWLFGLVFMEKTVELDNSEVLKDLENLSSSWANCLDTVGAVQFQSGLANPLEQLGLFMKDDHLDDDVDDWIVAAGNGDSEGETG